MLPFLDIFNAQSMFFATITLPSTLFTAFSYTLGYFIISAAIPIYPSIEIIELSNESLLPLILFKGRKVALPSLLFFK